MGCTCAKHPQLCRCPEIGTVFLKWQKLKGEKSLLGCCLWRLHICHSHPFQKCCRPKAEVCCSLSPEGLRVAGAFQSLVCLIHKKNIFCKSLACTTLSSGRHCLPGVGVWIAESISLPGVCLKAVGVRFLRSFVDLGLRLHQNHTEKSQWP